MLSIVLTKDEHQKFTKAKRLKIGYINDKTDLNTSNAKIEDIRNAAFDIYKDYPEILKALQLK